MVRDTPRLGASLAVLAKEVRDAARDPNALIFTLLFPLFFYPAVVWGLFQAAALQQGRLERSPPAVAWSGPEELARNLLDPSLRRIEGGPEAVLEGRAVAALEARDLPGGRVAIRATWRSTASEAAAVRHRIEERVEALRTERIEALSRRHAGDPRALAGPVVEVVDIASGGRRAAALAATLLPPLLHVMLLLGALAPAIDAVVGERERGTLETLLTAAPPRGWLLAGKFLAVLLATLAALAANALAMGLTLLHVQALFAPGSGPSPLPSPSQVLLALAALAGAATFVAALLVCVLQGAESVRAAEGIGTLVVFGGAVLALAGSRVPGPTPPAAALLPLWGTAAVVRDALREEAAAGTGLLAVGACVLGSLVLLHAAVRLLRGEGAVLGRRAGRST